MKLKEVTCQLFSPIRKGEKLTCKFLKDGFCMTDQFFDCIMSKKGEKEYHSYSSISTYHDCKRKYHIRYNLGYVPVVEPDWAVRGRVFHKLIADYYKSKKIPEILLKDTVTMVASTMAFSYVNYYNDYSGNDQIEVEKKTENLIAYIDRIVDKTIIDHKFSQNQPSFLDIALQGAFYFHILDILEDPCERFMVDFVRVPQLRQKGSESLEELSKRIIDDVKNRPLHYFNRTYYDKNEFKKFIPQIIKTISEIESKPKDGMYFFMEHKLSTFQCEYEPICLTDQIDTKLFKKVTKRSLRHE